jgi:ribosomal protein L15
VSAYARARNGRAAWFALRSHYLGPTNQSKIMTRAEGDLESKFYNGERRNFTFKRFAEIHQQAHTDLEEFGEPLTEAAKVRKFLKRIQALFLNSAIATVCANPSLKNDFEATVNFLSEFIEEQNQAQLRNILSGQSGCGRGQGRGSGRGNKGRGGRSDRGVFNKGSTKGMVDKYYTFDEYKSMNAEQKRHLHTLRQEAGGKRNASTVDSQEKEDDKKSKTSRDDTSSLTSKSSAGRNMSQRNSNMSVVSTRSISIQSLESAFISHAELDSHADTCCVGKNAYIFHETSRTVDVSAFLSTLGQARSVPIVSAALAYDHPYTYETFILIIHQALHFPTMEHNLLNPNQLRLNDVQVYDCPRFLLENPTDLSHSIYFPNENLKLHLQLDGVISYLPVRKPSPEEFRNFHKLTLTYDNPIWDPYSTDFTRQEEKYTDSKGILVTRQSGHANIQMISSHESTVSVVLSSISVSLDEQHFIEALEKTCLVSVAQSSNYRYRVTPEELARRWNIGLSAAKRTLLATTQRGVKDIASRTLTQRVKPTTSQLRYRHLRTSVYTDTMFSCVMSLSGNTCAQIYVNDLDWTRAYAMKSKGNAHETLDLLFHREGVPAEIISDGAKELVQGEFRRKVRAAGSHARQIEPYSPWLN